MILDFLKEAGILRKNKVDGCSLSTETASTTDSVDVVLFLHGELVVDNETDLLDIDTSGEQVSGDEDTNSTGSELLHHDFTLLLVHLTVHTGDDEILFGHGALELIDSLLSVTVDDSLLDIKVGVEVKKYIHLPLVLLDGDIVLVDTFEGQVFLLDENLGRISHEMLGQTQNVGRQGGREQTNLDICWQELEDVLNLWLETTGKHLVSFVQDEELEVVSLQETSSHHIMHATGCTDHDVLALLEDTDVLAHHSATDAGVNLSLQVLADTVYNKGDLHREFTSR